MKIRKKKSGLCHWGCGRTALNHSGICEECWTDRSILLASRKAEEAQKPKRVLSETIKEKLKASKKARIDAKIVIQATLGQKT